jgi:hypothetical protein
LKRKESKSLKKISFLIENRIVLVIFLSLILLQKRSSLFVFFSLVFIEVFESKLVGLIKWMSAAFCCRVVAH